jgi:hypothetical protein
MDNATNVGNVGNGGNVRKVIYKDSVLNWKAME